MTEPLEETLLFDEPGCRLGSPGFDRVVGRAHEQRNGVVAVEGAELFTDYALQFRRSPFPGRHPLATPFNLLGRPRVKRRPTIGHA